MDPSPLSITLFGSFAVSVGGQPLRPLRSRPAEWLLALLVLRHARAIPRAVLAATLWPESRHEQALLNLRRVLLELRQALGPEAVRLASPTRDSLLLDLTGADVDLLRFDPAVTAGDERSLEEAVALYRGELLEGCTEEWILGERQARQEACLQALERLADRSLARGDAPAALGYLRRAETLDGLRDSVQQRRMQALAASGDLPAALLTYREYRLRLHREMSLEPDPETTRLFRDLQAGRGVGRGGAETGRLGEPVASRPELPPIVLDHPLTPSPPSPASRVPALTPARPPRPLSPLLGREADVEAVTSLVIASRLLTLVGGGGVGKTRLALEIAAGLETQYPGRVLFVELAPLADPALLPAFVAAAVGLHEEGETPGAGSLVQTLMDRLSRQPTLLVLDNCEHLIQPAAELTQSLLAACPELHLLATSRQRLGVTGEVAWRVPSLSAPDPELLPGDTRGAVEHVHQYPAVRLFLERAAAVRPGVQLRDREEALALARICRRLDGIPLALELAAARMTVLSVGQIAARLDDRFRLLTSGSRGALPRHQTLRALIDWSYDSLPQEEAALLLRLSVFAGGWTLEAAEAVCKTVDSDQWLMGSSGKGADTEQDLPGRIGRTTNHHPPSTDVLDLLASLESRSMVLVEETEGATDQGARSPTSWAGGAPLGGPGPGGRRAPGQGLRYRMLETVREYAREKLRASGAEETARDQHLAYFLHRAEEGGPTLSGADPAAALALVESEIDNLRAALAWAQAQRPPTRDYLRLAAALWPFWATRGYLTEGRTHLRTALMVPGPPDALERAQALLGIARLAYLLHDLDEAMACGQESLEQFRARNDTRGAADALLCLGRTSWERGDGAAADRLLVETLECCRRCGWAQGSALALGQLGLVVMQQGDLTRARSLLEQGLAMAQTAGDALVMALLLRDLGYLAFQAGDDDRSQLWLEKALELHRRLGHLHGTALTLRYLGQVARRMGDLALALSYLEEAVATCRELGNRTHLAMALSELGSVFYMQGAYEQARPAYAESLDLFRPADSDWAPGARNNLGSTLFHLGDPAGAQALHREALALYHSQKWEEGVTWSLERLSVVEARHGDAQKAAQLMGAAAAARERLGGSLAQWDQADWDEAVAALRAALPAGALEAAWAEGRAMALDRVVEFASEGDQSSLSSRSRPARQ